MKKIFFAVFLYITFTSFVFSNNYAQRIVSLVPAITETIFEINAQNQLAARTDFCNFPAEANSISSVGGFDGKSISLEKILSYKPDLVCIADGMHNHLIKPLENFGIKVFISSAQNLSDIFSEIEGLAELTGHQQEASLCINRIKEQLSQAESLMKSQSPDKLRVYWEISSNPFFTCGNQSFISDLLQILGIRNIFSDIDKAYIQVNEESIIKRQPDIILFPDYHANNTVTHIKNRKNWQYVPAVSNGRIYPVDSDLFSRPGPRIGYMALELVKIFIQPEKGIEQ